MCTFKDERSVLVCDLALGTVRQEMTSAFPEVGAISYTQINGDGTLVRAGDSVSADRFSRIARTAIDRAQAGS